VKAGRKGEEGGGKEEDKAHQFRFLHLSFPSELEEEIKKGWEI